MALDAAIDRFDAFAERHRRPIAILSGAVFVATIATHAGFIRWPELAWLKSLPITMLATGWNALWWGYFNRRIVLRRASRAAQQPPTAES